MPHIATRKGAITPPPYKDAQTIQGGERKQDMKYPLVNKHSYGNSPSLMGKSTTNGPCSMAILYYQRVCGEYDLFVWFVSILMTYCLFDRHFKDVSYHGFSNNENTKHPSARCFGAGSI